VGHSEASRRLIMLTSVYQYHDGGGRILYVGVTARGIRRAHEHAEAKEWWPLCTGSTIEHYQTRDLALAREEQLIRRYKPPYNTVHNDRKADALDEYRRVGVAAPVNDCVRPLGPVTNKLTDAELKERRKRWYDLSPGERASTPCVSGGERRGQRGPECLVCRPSRSQTARR
jgi:excinuclease UvrABC nuclease subunit